MKPNTLAVYTDFQCFEVREYVTLDAFAVRHHFGDVFALAAGLPAFIEKIKTGVIDSIEVIAEPANGKRKLLGILGHLEKTQVNCTVFTLIDPDL